MSEEEDTNELGVAVSCQQVSGRGRESSHLDFQRSTEGHLERALNIFGENSLESLFKK